MALLTEEEKKRIRRELRARARKRGAWKGAGLKTPPKMSMKGWTGFSSDAAKKKLETQYIKSIGADTKQKERKAKIVKASYKKAKVGKDVKSAAMRASVSKTTGKKIPNLGKTAAGSMKKVAGKKGGGAARIAAKEWRTKHMAKAKTLKGAAKRDAMRDVQKAFKHKIGA
jgi:hypothetical protein